MSPSLNYQKTQIVNLNRYYEKPRVCVASFIYVVNIQAPPKINPFISLRWSVLVNSLESHFCLMTCSPLINTSWCHQCPLLAPSCLSDWLLAVAVSGQVWANTFELWLISIICTFPRLLQHFLDSLSVRWCTALRCPHDGERSQRHYQNQININYNQRLTNFLKWYNCMD